MRTRTLLVLTNSAGKTYASCARLYQLSYVDLIKPLLPGEALVFGDLIHKGLEAWWKAAQSHPAQPCPICTGADESGFMCQDCGGSGSTNAAWLRAAIAAVQSDQDPFRRSAIEAMLIGYHERWRSMTWEGAPYDGAPIEVLGVEVEFRGPLTNPATGGVSKTWQRGGKIDVLVKVNGDVWVVEHKSSGEDFGPGSPYRQRLKLDTQVSGYHVGARLLGHQEVKGVLYDVLGKPGIKPLRATPPDKRKYTKPTAKEPVPRLYAWQREHDESPEEFQGRVFESIAGGDAYARFEVVRLQAEESAAAQDTWQRAEEIRDAMRLNRWPRNPGACTAYGRLCPYMPICAGEATANDGTRYRRAETAHEELGGQGQAEKKEAA